MALNSFSVPLFLPPAPEVLAKIKRAIYTAFYPLFLRLELSHNAIENKVYYDFATSLYCFSKNKERKRIDWPEVIGVPKAMSPSPCNSNAINDKKNDNKAYCLFNFCLF